MTRTVDKLIERLALLASGEEPRDRRRGICWDVEEHCSEASLDLLPFTWEAMGLHPVNPIGPRNYAGYGHEPQWTGRLGKLRRYLCKNTVFHLVKQYGYKGGWA